MHRASGAHGGAPLYRLTGFSPKTKPPPGPLGLDGGWLAQMDRRSRLSRRGVPDRLLLDLLLAEGDLDHHVYPASALIWLVIGLVLLLPETKNRPSGRSCC